MKQANPLLEGRIAWLCLWLCGLALAAANLRAQQAGGPADIILQNGKIAYVHRGFAREYNLSPPGTIISTYEELKARRKPFGFSAGGG